jgi:hypothetical protein
MSGRDWRSEDAHRDLDELNLRGLAWEYLRRNPDYIQDYRSIATASDIGPEVGETARTWGLRFRGRSDASRHRRTRLLGSEIVVGDRGDRSAGRAGRPLDHSPELASGLG